MRMRLPLLARSGIVVSRNIFARLGAQHACDLRCSFCFKRLAERIANSVPQKSANEAVESGQIGHGSSLIGLEKIRNKTIKPIPYIPAKSKNNQAHWLFFAYVTGQGLRVL